MMLYCVCVCVCVFSSHSFWTSTSLDVPAGVTQEEGHTGFLIHLSAVRAFIFLARRIQQFLSLVDCEVEFCVLMNRWAFLVLFFSFLTLPPGLPLPGWAEIRQWAYSTQIPLYKDGDTSPSLVLTGSLGLIDRSYRDREIGVSPVGPTLAAAWG